MVRQSLLVTEIAPSIFSYLRTLDGITRDDIKESLDIEKNLKAIFAAGES